VGSGRIAEARNLEPHLEPLAERIGNVPALLLTRRARHGMADFAETGDLAALEAFARADLALLEQGGLPWTHHSHSWLGLGAFLRGDWDRARDDLETAVTTESPGPFDGVDRAFLFEFRAYAGECGAALAMLDGAEDSRMPVAGQPNQWGRWAMLLSVVEGLVVLDQMDRAAPLYELVCECIRDTASVCQPYFQGVLLERTAGIAAMAGRRWDDAETHFRTALRQAETLPHRPEAAHTRRFFARMLLDRDGADDRARAAELSGEAVDLYRRMGMPRHEAMARALVTRTGAGHVHG
jgi:hypothetical protein